MHRSMSSRTVLRVGVGVVVASVVAALAAPGCIVDWGDDCSHGFGWPGCSGGVAGLGGAGVGGGSQRGGWSGGGDGSTGCGDAGPCVVPPGPCAALGTAACVKGVCAFTYTPGDASWQAYGTCMKRVCDDAGTLSMVEDDANVFDDGNQCTTDKCFNGTPFNTPSMGASCVLPNMIERGPASPLPIPSTRRCSCARCAIR